MTGRRALPRHLVVAWAACALVCFSLLSGCGRKSTANADKAKASAKATTGGSPPPAPEQTAKAAKTEKPAEDKAAAKPAEGAEANVDPAKRAEATALAMQARREAMAQPRPLVANGNEALARQRDRRAEPPRELVRHLRPIIRYKDVKSLKRYCSDRLAATLDDTVAKHGDRFWKHLAKYGDAFDGGYAVELGEADAEGRVPTTVRGKDGLELRPVLLRGDQGFVFDRF